jgi:hypothetical protein
VNLERKVIVKDQERDIVIGMIVSSDFLKQIKKIYKPEFLTLPYAKTVSQWCMEYHDKYERAPFMDIQSLFEANKDAVIGGKEKVEMIETFLESISSKFEGEEDKYNLDYNIDKAESYFKEISLELFENKIKGLRLRKDYSGAEAEIANYRRVEKDIHGGLDVWNPEMQNILGVIRREEDPNALFKFPGELGRFIRTLKRKDFVAWLGPGGRGKTYWLIETALQSSYNQLNTLLISLEMPEEDVLTRIYQRLTGQFISEFDSDDRREIEIPFFDKGFEMNRVVHSKKVIRECLDASGVLKKITDLKSLVKNSRLRIVTSPAGSLKVSDISSILDNYEHYDDFIPDVIVVDYADITSPESRQEKRHQIDEIWQGYRAIAQKRNCLVVTASHTNKNTFDRDIREGDASEDYRKFNHLTLALGLNQTNEEAKKNIMRINMLKDRSRRAQKTKEVVVLQNLDIGQICIDSKIVDIRTKE